MTKPPRDPELAKALSALKPKRSDPGLKEALKALKERPKVEAQKAVETLKAIQASRMSPKDRARELTRTQKRPLDDEQFEAMWKALGVFGLFGAREDLVESLEAIVNAKASSGNAS